MASWKGHCTKEYRNSILRNSEKALYTVQKKEEKNGGRGSLQDQVGRNCEGELCRWGNFVCRSSMMHQMSGCKLVDKLSSMRSWCLFVLLINWDLWVSNQVDQLYQVGFLRNLGTMPSPDRFIECFRLIWHLSKLSDMFWFKTFNYCFKGWAWWSGSKLKLNIHI